MQYPSLRDCQNAIVNQNNFNIPFFQSESLEIFLNPRGYPFMFVGGCGSLGANRLSHGYVRVVRAGQ